VPVEPERWQPIVDASLSFASQLTDATDLGLKNAAAVKRALDTFRGLINATAEANRKQYDAFAARVEEAL
jgi:hypothetical protein